MKEILAGLIRQSCADSKWEELSPPIKFLQNEQVINLRRLLKFESAGRER